jgi:hypothetical protein
VLSHGNSLDCGLYMSGTPRGPAAAAPRGGTPAAAAPGPSCQTRAGGGARSFEEAEETRYLLKPRSDIARGNPG